jgi:hypothetical protein
MSCGPAAWSASTSAWGRDATRWSPTTPRARCPAVLDSREGLPVGDLFAVTPIRPGTYRARNQHNQTSLEFLVRMPGQGEPYSPARATLIEVGEQGFDPPSARILAGQSLVFLAWTPARLVVEPVQAS